MNPQSQLIPTSDHCSGMSRLRWCLVITTLGASFCTGCGDSGPTEAVQQARKALQMDDVQEAIDELIDEGDQTAEAHYLKAVALDRRNKQNVAREEIDVAIDLDPENVKYRGLRLRFDLFRQAQEGQVPQQVVEQLTELYESNPSSAAAAFFAFYAHQAQWMQRFAENKPDEANQHYKQAIEALQTAATLASEIPEFQREMLVFCIQFKLPDEARELMKKLKAVDPENPDLLQDEIAVLMLTNNAAEATPLARKYYERSNGSEETAAIYAKVLERLPPDRQRDDRLAELLKRYPKNQTVVSSVVNALIRSPATAERDKLFADLVAKFSDSVQVVSNYAIYLTRNDRFDQAIQTLTQEIDRRTLPEQRWPLVNVALSLTLEAGNTEVAEQLWKSYHNEIPEPTIAVYFEGRLLELQEQFARAIENYESVVDAEKRQPGKFTVMARDAQLRLQLLRDSKKPDPSKPAEPVKDTGPEPVAPVKPGKK